MIPISTGGEPTDGGRVRAGRAGYRAVGFRGILASAAIALGLGLVVVLLKVLLH